MAVTPHRTVSLLTPVLPSLAAHLDDTAQSVASTKEAAASMGWSVEWILAVDGPEEVPRPEGADKFLRLETTGGAAVARNLSLAQAQGEWIAPLDADDALNPAGFIELLKATEANPARWIGANRVFMNGEKTLHWKDSAETWQAGELAECWTAPFCFHPNSILVRRDLAQKAQGWPALPTNEDLAFVLTISEIAAGCFVPQVMTRYRVWNRQTIANPAYATLKKSAFATITETLNARRKQYGRPPIMPPDSGSAYGHLQKE